MNTRMNGVSAPMVPLMVAALFGAGGATAQMTTPAPTTDILPSCQQYNGKSVPDLPRARY